MRRSLYRGKAGVDYPTTEQYNHDYRKGMRIMQAQDDLEPETDRLCLENLCHHAADHGVLVTDLLKEDGNWLTGSPLVTGPPGQHGRVVWHQ